MAITLGPAQAILYGTAAPTNTNVIWGETDNNDPLTQQVLNFWRFDASIPAWVVIVSDDPNWQTTAW